MWADCVYPDQTAHRLPFHLLKFTAMFRCPNILIFTVPVIALPCPETGSVNLLFLSR